MTSPLYLLPSEDQIKTNKRSAIGAFCTDISNSTERIEKFQEEALRHHKTYLEAAGKYFIGSVPRSSRQKYVTGDLWVPGDALWGVFYKETGESVHDSVVAALWRAIVSFAHGLSAANSQSAAGLESLRIRGVFLAGHVMRETIFRRLRLYNGTALNACGRLEKNAAPNTIIAGFVIPIDASNGELLFEVVARSPVVNVSGLKRQIRARPTPTGVGCDIELDVVRDKDKQLLRFRGWPTREDLRGLSRCRVITTTITLKPKEEQTFDVCPNYSGHWDRKEALLSLGESTSRFDLIELLDRANRESFKFVKEIYAVGDIEFFISPEHDKAFTLQCYRKTDRPRLQQGDKTKLVDFTKHSDCVLPTHTYPISGGAQLLIQAHSGGGNRVLRFCKVAENALKSYGEYADYMDSAEAVIEFKFRR